LQRAGHIVAAGLQDAQPVCCTGTLMSNGQLVHYDLQAESSVWLFKSPLAGGGSTLWQPHYRPHSLLSLYVPIFYQQRHLANIQSA